MQREVCVTDYAALALRLFPVVRQRFDIPRGADAGQNARPADPVKAGVRRPEGVALTGLGKGARN